jgi:hypothetical protein
VINHQGPGALDRSKRMIPLQLKRARPRENRINSEDNQMTEAGKQWVSSTIHEEDPDEWERVSALSRRAAEFWLRAFVAEVEKRAAALFPLSRRDAMHQAYKELTRELIGDDNAK